MSPITRLRWAAPVVIALMLVAGAWVGLAAPGQLPTIVGGFQRHDFSVSDQQQDGAAPSLAVGNVAADAATPIPWVAFAQRQLGAPTRDILVRSFRAETNRWVTRGLGRNQGSLNFDRNVAADQPALDFAGAIIGGARTQPWVVWQEPVLGLNRRVNIFASKLVLDAGSEVWQRAGRDRGNGQGITSLNVDISQDAENPALAGGATEAEATETYPWVTWEEFHPVAGRRQIFAARGEPASGADILGGLRWTQVGAVRPIGGPSLNVDTARNGRQPDIVFSGPNNIEPWAVWYEEGQGREQRVFAAKAVADASAPGGFRWVSQPGCGSDERTCALNRNANRHALNPKIASGALADEHQAEPKPWAVWQESNGRNFQVVVSRFDGTRWVPVGGPLNVSPNNDAVDPDIFFVGAVPHVAWTERQGPGGFSLLMVRHLADARPGRERWDLDSLSNRGLNLDVFNVAIRPSLHGTRTAPFVAWQEPQRFGGESLVLEARRVPEGPAWGSNYPPYIRIISGTRNLAQTRVLPLTGETQASVVQTQDEPIGQVTITTTCDHVNGWDNIVAIHFKLSDANSTVFHGKYESETGLIYVEDPDRPGTFLGGVAPGAGTTIETRYVSLDVGQMSVEGHGPSSPALDIKWVIGLKRPTLFNEYTQSINIVSRQVFTSTVQIDTASRLPLLAWRDEPQSDPHQVIIEETGFFEVGNVRVVFNQLFLPLINQMPPPRTKE